jgi:hypothetical protein
MRDEYQIMKIWESTLEDFHKKVHRNHFPFFIRNKYNTNRIPNSRILSQMHVIVSYHVTNTYRLYTVTPNCTSSRVVKYLIVLHCMSRWLQWISTSTLKWRKQCNKFSAQCNRSVIYELINVRRFSNQDIFVPEQ